MVAKRVIVPGPSKLVMDPVELGLKILRVKTAKFSKRKSVLISLLFGGSNYTFLVCYRPGLLRDREAFPGPSLASPRLVGI